VGSSSHFGDVVHAFRHGRVQRHEPW
jgi:hypothetical protein